MADDELRYGESRAIDWVAGRSEMDDDLAHIVTTMDWPLDAAARAFLQTVGNVARAEAKRAEQAARDRAAASAGEAPAPGPSPAPSPIGWEELRRQRLEHARRERFEELARKNAQLFSDYRHEGHGAA